uniref:Putative secreted peptide n=1 Tax=Anopheles braziliensis TaxID=58242 RepID=A0A2M3ZQT6_9DIPT
MDRQYGIAQLFPRFLLIVLGQCRFCFEVFDNQLLYIARFAGSCDRGHLEDGSVGVAQGGKVGTLPVVLVLAHRRRVFLRSCCCCCYRCCCCCCPCLPALCASVSFFPT